jgi:hypothetical protein
MLRRAYTCRPVLSDTRSKEPPTTTVSPTTAAAHTVPFSTCGVWSTGLVETTVDWFMSATAGRTPARPARARTAVRM